MKRILGALWTCVLWVIVIVWRLVSMLSIGAILTTAFFVMLTLRLSGNIDASWWWVCSPVIALYAVAGLLAVYEMGKAAGK